MALSTTQIKKAMKDRGLTYREIAAMATPPVSLSLIAKNVNKVEGCKSVRARETIARALGMKVEDVYGDGASRQMVGHAA